MKNQGLIGRLLLLAAVIPAFASCLDKPDIPKIGISNQVLYVVQNTTEDGTEYALHAGFEYSGDEELDYGVIARDGVPFDLETNKEVQFCQIDPRDETVTTLTDLNGDYTFNPVGIKGHDWERTYPLEFTGDEYLEEVEVLEFGYKDGQIYATFNKNGAEYYGFFIQAYIGSTVNTFYAIGNDYAYLDNKNYALNMFRVRETDPAQVTTHKFSFAFNLKEYEYYYGPEQVLITPVGINLSEGDYKWNLVRKSKNTGILKADDTEKVWVAGPAQPE